MQAVIKQTCLKADVEALGGLPLQTGVADVLEGDAGDILEEVAAGEITAGSMVVKVVVAGEVKAGGELQVLDGYPNNGSVIVNVDDGMDKPKVVDYNTTDTAKAYFAKLNEEYYKGILDPERVVDSVALLRLVNPSTPLRFAGGRRDMSDETAAKCIYVGMSAGIAGPLLTTPGADFDDDRHLAALAGYAVRSN